MSSSHPGGSGSGGSGGSTTFSSSSLNALQAISEGVGTSLPSSLPSALTSPPLHKPDSSPSINSTQQNQSQVQSQGGPCKPGPLAHSDSKSPGSSLGSAGEQLSQQHPHTPTTEGPDKPDSQAGREGAQPGGEPSRRVPDAKSHKKLLQLLTSPTDELVQPNPTPGSGSIPMGAEGKDGLACVTSPSSTGVSSSTNGVCPQGLGVAVSSTGAAGNFANQ